MTVVMLPGWQFWIICVLCLIPTINRLLDAATEKLRKQNNELAISINDRIDKLHK